MSTDLELVLDKIQVDYPSFVKEAFSTVTGLDFFINCGAINDTHCWIITKQCLFIWERPNRINHNRRVLSTTRLAPPSTGLTYSTKCVVVYQTKHRDSRTIGVLITSREGVLRHWTSIKGEEFSEVTLELDSEVVLNVQLLQNPSHGRPASFLLTTTSGTIYMLRGSKEQGKLFGTLEAVKMYTRERPGVYRRISSIVFGAPEVDLSTSVNESIIIWKHDVHPDAYKQPLVVMVSTRTLTVYDLEEQVELWTVKAKELFSPLIKRSVRRKYNDDLLDVDVSFIQVARFGSGLLILLDAYHNMSDLPEIFLAYIANWMNTEAPTQIDWMREVDLDDVNFNDRCYRTTSESEIWKLIVPKKTADQGTSDMTDGVILVHPDFVKSFYLPEDIEVNPSAPFKLEKTLELDEEDNLLGVSQNRENCFVMLLKDGIHSVRLLPKGFMEETRTADNEALAEVLTDSVGINATGPIAVLVQSLELFGDKKMAEASAALAPLLELSSEDLLQTFEQLLTCIIDHSDSSTVLDAQLKSKRSLVHRVLLFIKHMNLIDRITKTRFRVVQDVERPDGLHMLTEMNERVGAAISIYDWQLSAGEQCQWLMEVAKIVENVAGDRAAGAFDVESVLYGKLSLIHLFPAAVGALVKDLKKKRGLGTAIKVKALQTCSELLVSFGIGVQVARQTIGWPQIDEGQRKWTTEDIATTYLMFSAELLQDASQPNVSLSERSKAVNFVKNLVAFHLSEVAERPNNNFVLRKLYEMGEKDIAMSLAENCKDFYLLAETCLTYEPKQRQYYLDLYKRNYIQDDFEMFLCKFLKEKGLGEVLLEQRGQRVDEFLDNFKELRYSREIANKQYAQAAQTLYSLAEQEKDSFQKFALYLSKAKTCAMASNGEASEVLRFCERRQPEVKHRRAIPTDLIKAVYAEKEDGMLTVDELLELNLMRNQNDEETVAGALRALALVSDLLKLDEESEDVQDRVHRTWVSIVQLQDWNKVKTRIQIGQTLFGRILSDIVYKHSSQPGNGFPFWSAIDRQSVLPQDVPAVISDANLGPNTEAVTEFVWQEFSELDKKLTELAQAPRASFFHHDLKNCAPTAAGFLSGMKRFYDLRDTQNLPTFKGSRCNYEF